jgi:16S rRNA (cytosine1402-N4)-methyltransferase
MSKFHTSVLLKESIDFLKVRKGKKYIDATLGGGGHAEEIMSLGGIVLGIDTDSDAIEYVKKNFESRVKNEELTITKGNFKDLKEIAHLKFFDRVYGILFDLGVSSHQIDSANRGFSFLKDGPLDMRMDQTIGAKAENLVNLLEKGELYELFNNLGQDSHSWAVSNNIVSARRVKAIQTTSELVDVVARANGLKGEVSDFKKNEINKKIFQALRIAVNNELENIKLALPQALELLESGGRIVVISFHSLEDRIIKNSFKDFEKNNMGKIITKKPIEVSEEEVLINSRARSAKLRVFEKN